MHIIDYNGAGKWSAQEVLRRYERYAREMGIAVRDLSPEESEDRHREKKWVYPVMEKVIEGIEAGDGACMRIGVEFIEENAGFVFGWILKTKTARVLKRAALTEKLKARIRRRVFGMLRAGNVPREFRDYARLVRGIGFELKELEGVGKRDKYVKRYCQYFREGAHESGAS